jgi:hypothetical protein
MVIFSLPVFLTPYYITRDFPDRENIKNYTQTSYQKAVAKDGELDITGPSEMRGDKDHSGKLMSLLQDSER